MEQMEQKEKDRLELAVAEPVPAVAEAAEQGEARTPS